MRLRLETAKRLRALGVERRKGQKKDPDHEVVVKTMEVTSDESRPATSIQARKPKVKKTNLASPPPAKAKFRKRQKNKTWLPTHMFHSKRARMTAPTEPLWKFAIPLTPTAKTYRPTHRAANDRGAVAWDMSYMSAIGLEGQQRSIEGLLRALGIGSQPKDANLLKATGERWRNGTRIWSGFIFEREDPHAPIAPATVIWCGPSDTQHPAKENDPARAKRKVIIRLHPSAFFRTWEEVIRLSKVAKPQISVEDLRFEIGSIEITGPGASEALQSALWTCQDKAEAGGSNVAAKTWKSLAGLSNAAVLPQNVALGLNCQDPRLHHPPRTTQLPHSAAEQDNLVEVLAAWPPDADPRPSALFDRRARLAASSSLPSQKAINRRKSLAAPGQYPEPVPSDATIPVLLYCQTNPNRSHATWTVLLPWKCVQPVWYSLMYYPLSTGGQPRFGGLDEQRQLAFETGRPWFPGDFPGTAAGWQWEAEERKKREDAIKRKPKSKRVNLEAVDLGCGRKGESGNGWACDWERLMSGPPQQSDLVVTDASGPAAPKAGTDTKQALPANPCTSLIPLHTPSQRAQAYLHKGDTITLPDHAVTTVHIKLLTRGVPQTCARIYRLPSEKRSPKLRNKWLALHPRHHSHHKPSGRRNDFPRIPKTTPDHVKRRLLAQALLEPPRIGDDEYPACPGEEDLIGFVTTGNYNLAEGQGTGIGNVLLRKVVQEIRTDAEVGKLCIVRNVGNGAGRLAKWELA